MTSRVTNQQINEILDLKSSERSGYTKIKFRYVSFRITGFVVSQQTNSILSNTKIRKARKPSRRRSRKISSDQSQERLLKLWLETLKEQPEKVLSHNLRLEKKVCVHCSTDDTPQWRKGPDGLNTLCNACGLQYTSFKEKKEKNYRTGNIALILDR